MKMPGKISKTSSEKHEGDIMSVAFNDGFVFTGGVDGKVMVIIITLCFSNFCTKQILF